MTEAEMKQRIKDIEKQRMELTKEKDEYVKILSEKKREQQIAERGKLVGKCYKQVPGITSTNSKVSYVKAFKILENADTSCAICLGIIKGFRCSIWEEQGIERLVLPLWSPNIINLMPQKDSLLVIDNYTQITDEEFNKLLEETYNSLVK